MQAGPEKELRLLQSFPAFENVIQNGPSSLPSPCFSHKERNASGITLAMIFTLFFFGFSDTSSYSLAKERLQGEPIWTSAWSEACSSEVRNKQTAPDIQLWITGTDFRWCQNSKQSLMAFTVQKQACLIIIFSTLLKLVIMYFWFTVLMPGNCVTFILPCRITWEYSLERKSHWAKAKKQSRHTASSEVPSHIFEIEMIPWHKRFWNT